MSTSQTTMVVLIPVYNDWPSVSMLLPLLAEELGRANVVADVLLVDDRSTQQPAAGQLVKPEGVKSLSVLRLRRNLSHQRDCGGTLPYSGKHALPERADHGW